MYARLDADTSGPPNASRHDLLLVSVIITSFLLLRRVLDYGSLTPWRSHWIGGGGGRGLVFGIWGGSGDGIRVGWCDSGLATSVM